MPIFRNTLFLTVLLALPLLSNAQVLINEIMYDSPGADDDWVEIYNSGGTPINIVTGSGNGSWRFVDSGSHVLTLISGNNNLDSQGYAIITNDVAKFQTDWPQFSGTLFKSSFSITNTSASLYIKDGSGNITDQVSYSSDQGAKGDGNSLQRNESSWIAAGPTPGSVNTSSASNPTDTSTTTNLSNESQENQLSTPEQNNTNNNEKLSSHYGSVILTDVKSKAKFTVGAGRSRLSTVGTPVEFKAESNTDYTRSVTFKWSFGDGGVAEGETVHHVYNYPGEYVVMLNAAARGTGEGASRTTVKVLPAELSVSIVMLGGIEISNDSKDEINLYGRALVSGSSIYIFPKDTIMLGKQKIVFDNSITGLHPQGVNDVYLAMIGDEVENLGILSRNTKENIIKAAKIKILENKIADIGKKLNVSMRSRQTADLVSTSNIYSEGKYVTSLVNTASIAFAASNTNTSTPQRAWIKTVKHFFGFK